MFVCVYLYIYTHMCMFKHIYYIFTAFVRWYWQCIVELKALSDTNVCVHTHTHIFIRI